MIREWYDSLTMMATPEARRLRLNYEAAAIEARFRRCKAAWTPHLEKSRGAILAAVQQTKPEGKIVIIGSGGLHDVALSEIARGQRRIELWDVCHPLAARQAASRLDNVTLHLVDITGLQHTIDNDKKNKDLALPDPMDRATVACRNADLVVSLNLLSQLPLPITRALKGRLNEAERETYGAAIIKAHVNWLKAQGCPALLLTDIERQYLKGEILEVEDALPSAGLPAPTQVWTWLIAPKGESLTCDRISHKVALFHLAPASKSDRPN